MKSKDPSAKKFTYADYQLWPEDERWELIDGIPYAMTPAPSKTHQQIHANVFGHLWNFFQGKPCQVFSAPFDVRFPKAKEPDEKTDTIVQPDLVVVCDPEKLDEKGCCGSPDLVIEIISPSTSSRDQVTKLNLYEKHGVKEYWVIDPNGMLMIFDLQENSRYGRPQTFDCKAKAASPLFPGLLLDLSKVFPPKPKLVRESPKR